MKDTSQILVTETLRLIVVEMAAVVIGPASLMAESIPQESEAAAMAHDMLDGLKLIQTNAPNMTYEELNKAFNTLSYLRQAMIDAAAKVKDGQS